MSLNTPRRSSLFINALTRWRAIGGLVTILTLGACTPVGALVGAGAGVGVAHYQERGIDGVARDLKTSASIMNLWFQKNHEMNTKLSVEVYEGRAMLTGAVEDENLRADAVALAWKADGVTDVINEIQISTSGIVNHARDTWITAQINADITFDRNIMAINYSVETVNQIVYLIGIAQNAEELERVKEISRSISYVKRIISHVRIKEAA